MEIRKVQITGGSSYVISLPKDWARSLNIQKNNPLGLIRQSDGTLLITPKISGEMVQRIKTFDVSRSSDPDFLFRCLIAAYIMGYTTIMVTSSGRIAPAVRVVVRDFTQIAIGQEVAEESDASITIKDLLNPVEMPFDNTLKRMYILARGMHEDAISTLRTRNRALAEDVIARDDEIDRLQWLLARQYHLIVTDGNLSKRMGMSVGTATNYLMISRIVERIGDHAVNIATNALALMEQDLDDLLITDIESASASALSIFNASIRSFFKKDILESNDNIRAVAGLVSCCEEISHNVLQQRSPVAIPVGYIIESVRRLGEYSKDISENVINYLVSEEQ
ncbi:AbrB/MazE/SpoVT family DNA-binding domain-containing protein [Methanoculleus sp. FWC-SCC1]|uniref:AbrB/MazE/SpoVT family DNA-binding domain-containing protein n=1 Tax=Methanoculleus frigidifontis TaxID=2584085 RepID=A0ABT8M7H2_9EURY|nr:phosphate uptake regulator PhoU [Methanoculleus sp. FWC-SCC1]MDN7023880.1 AbrB/MazE/SpoVT family DNA-binding domain-containing protein [Methanoculleus sp. FWC-SCC1]